MSKGIAMSVMGDESAGFLQNWLEFSPDPMVLLGANYQVRQANTPAQELLQKSDQARQLEKSPGSLLDYFEKEIRTALEESLQNCQTLPAAVRVSAELAGGPVVELSLYPLSLLTGQQNDEFLVIMQDRSELNLLERELHGFRQKYQALLKAAPLSLIVIDALGRIVDLSLWHLANIVPPEHPVDQLFGVSLVGNLPGCPPEIEQVIPLLLRGEAFHFHNLSWSSPSSGQDLFFEAQGVPLFGHLGEVNGALIVLLDKTAELELEKKSLRTRSLETIGLLAAGMASDFHTTMLAVQNQVRQLKARLEPYEPLIQEEMLAIESATQRGLRISREMLDFTHPPQSQVEVVSLNDVIRQTTNVLQSSYGGRVAFSLELEQELPSLRGSQSGIVQALTNLCLKAVETMPHGGTLRIKTGYLKSHELEGIGIEEAPEGAVWVAVKDEGPGMPAEMAKDTERSLGAAASPAGNDQHGYMPVQHVLRHHGAAVHVESQIGRGSTFALYFPAAGTADSAPAPEENSPGRNGKLILLVDDEPLICRIGRRMLEAAGYLVLVAASGEQALEFYRQKSSQIDLVILDLILPDKGGIEVLNQILELNPRAKVLLSSGYATEGGVEEMLTEGAKGFLQKPYRIKEMISKVQSVLDPSAANQEAEKEE